MAGLHAARAIRTDAIRLTVVEPTGHHQFLTRLAAVAAGTQPASDAAAPLTEMLPDADIQPATVLRIDEAPDQVRVMLDDNRVLDADVVIVTAGAETRTPPVDGFHRAMSLRSASDAIGIRQKLEPTGQPGVERLIVVGGGATGCQLAAAAAVAHPDLDVTLIEATARVLSAFAPALGRHAAKVLRRRGVDLRCESRVETIGERGLTLTADGTGSSEALDGLVVWAGGVKGTGDTFGLGSTRDGRLVIEETGRTTGSARVFAAGDIAAHTDRREGLRPMSAQIAAQAGRGVGENVQRFLAGQALNPLSLADLGWVVDLGGGQGVADLIGLPLADDLSARLVPLLHTAIDYRNLWQLGGIDFMRRFGPGSTNAPSLEQLAADLAAFGVDLDDPGIRPS